MRWIKILATFVVVLFVVIPFTAFMLVSTSTGTRFLLAQSLPFAPVNISYAEVEGTLIDEITFKQLTLDLEGQRVSVERLAMVWRPFELFEKRLVIDTLELQHPVVQLLNERQQSDTPITLPNIALPIAIYIAQLSVDDLTIQMDEAPESRTTYPLKLITQVQLVDSTLDLTRLRLEFSQPQFALSHSGELSVQLYDGYALSSAGNYQLEFADERIESVAGDLLLQGALQNQPIELQTTFTTATAPAQTLTAVLSEPLAQLSWTAGLELNQFPLALAKPWLSELPEVDGLITNQTAASGTAQLNSERLLIENIEATHIGSNNGHVKLNGTWQHNNFAGDYAENPLDFAVSYERLMYSINDLNISVTQGRSSIDGTLADYAFKNELKININGHEELTVDDLTTSINGTGSLTHVSISQLQLDSDKLKLESEFQAGWQEALEMDLKISSATTSLGLPDASESLQLQGNIQLKDHQLNFSEFVTSLGETRLTLNGSTAQDDLRGQITIGDLQKLPYLPEGLSELQALETSFAIDTDKELRAFSFDFSSFTIQTESLDAWQLTEPARLALQQSEGIWLAQLGGLCLQHAPNQFGVLCSEGELTTDSIDVQLTGERLSLWLLNRFRERDVAQRIAGLVSLKADTSISRAELQVRDLNLNLRSENTVFFALNQETSTRLAYWEIAANGSADAITATIEGQLSSSEGGLFGDFSITDLYESQTIDGSLLFALDDLAMLDWVLPGMRYHGGKATAQLELGGTLAEPTINGDMEVYAESVVFAETNFVFNDVRLALIDRPDSEGSLEIEGQAKAGEEGWILVEGVALPLDAEAYLRITGQNFRALQMPTATVDVSPDLTVYVNDRAIEIAGTVDVPYAAIASPEFESSVSNSSDVVVTQDGAPITDSLDDNAALAVNAQIRVNLGERVSVDAYGFTGRLQGSLEIVEEPNRPTTAVGSINVANGSYELYGQELNIDRGAFIYNGGDVSNPGLDLRVKRDISDGNSTGNVNVGAQVVGTLVEPDFRLFSTPAMPDSEILSYLILGKSMQSASTTNSSDIQLQALLMLGAKGTEAIGESLQDTFGIDEFGIDTDPNTRETSFYIGKYLSPRLFVKYGVGLLESTNTFMVRYQLTERLLIETMANSQAQGGDIFYTFER